MCIICRGKRLVGLTTLNLEGCQQITSIPHIVGLKKLWCNYTQINSIPHIVGLNELWCNNTRITSIPHITGLNIYHHRCHWLDKKI